MKKVLFILALLLTVSLSAQTYKKVGNELVKVETVSTKAQPVKTELTVTIKDTIYPVYKTTRGKYYIKRVSKNTGKEYKQYLKLEE
jgi:archaellum component FlaG (FlaF/FlaG flagellin family)